MTIEAIPHFELPIDLINLPRPESANNLKELANSIHDLDLLGLSLHPVHKTIIDILDATGFVMNWGAKDFLDKYSANNLVALKTAILSIDSDNLKDGFSFLFDANSLDKISIEQFETEFYRMEFSLESTLWDYWNACLHTTTTDCNGAGPG